MLLAAQVTGAHMHVPLSKDASGHHSLRAVSEVTHSVLDHFVASQDAGHTHSAGTIDACASNALAQASAADDHVEYGDDHAYHDTHQHPHNDTHHSHADNSLDVDVFGHVVDKWQKSFTALPATQHNPMPRLRRIVHAATSLGHEPRYPKPLFASPPLRAPPSAA
jgi:hypothetical protein